MGCCICAQLPLPRPAVRKRSIAQVWTIECPQQAFTGPTAWIQTLSPLLNTFTRPFCNIVQSPVSHHPLSFHSFQIGQRLYALLFTFSSPSLKSLWVQFMPCTCICYICALPCQHYLPVQRLPALSVYKYSPFDSIISLLISHNLTLLLDSVAQQQWRVAKQLLMFCGPS